MTRSRAWAVSVVVAAMAILGGGMFLGMGSGSSAVRPAASVAAAVPAGTNVPATTVMPTPSATGPASLPSNLVPHVAYHGPAPAHYPASWGNLHMPPGAPVPLTPAGLSTNQFLQTWSDGSKYPYVHGTCVGKWPTGGEGSYSGGCIGHDEPAINPFSDLPGSGGNVSWNVDLPVDAAPGHIQADTYIAIWFGMDLYDPYGYNGQCFLELQMYPDTNGAGFLQFNKWSAFTVAWQIELSTGFEDPCIAAPMIDTNGVTPLQMNGGDHLYVNMTGWVGSPWGENISILDATTGTTSNLNLYNTSLHYPLNPAFSTNNIDDSLPWSPGGDLPVAFSFESGHTINGPGNDTFGGCNSGAPPPTPLNPSAPCGSYNPRSWAADTASPWKIHPVTFFNAHARQTAVQYGFEQDFGAMAWVDGLSYGTCTGKDGSAYCSYPWYSWSASQDAFEFGATDYSGTSQDFGQYNEYDSLLLTDSSGLNFYPVKNFTYLDPAGASLTLRLVGQGTVYFLNHAITHTTTFSELPSGAYSLNAAPAAGLSFGGYQGRGSVHLDAVDTAWSSFYLHGDAAITIHFGATPLPPASVTFTDTGGHGSVSVAPGFEFSVAGLYALAPGFGLLPIFHAGSTDVANHGTLSLTPGMYSLLAQPKPGYNFTGWSASNPGIYLFTPASNYTWVNVTGTSGTVTAHYSPVGDTTTVWLDTFPAQGGRILFNGHSYSDGAVFTAPVGAYSLTAVPAPGYVFAGWAGGLMSSMTDWGQSATVAVAGANSYVTAAFRSSPILTDGASHGQFAIDGQVVSTTRTFTQVGDTNYSVGAVPASGYVFTHWAATPARAAAVADPSSPLTTVQLNGTATLTPHFARASGGVPVSVTAAHGSVLINVVDRIRGATTLGGVLPSTYSLTEHAASGYAFAGWTTSGGVSVETSYLFNGSTIADVENLAGTWTFVYALVVTGAGHLTAHFVPLTYHVTFIDFPFNPSVTLSIHGAGPSTILSAGTTAHLAPGTYRVTVHGWTGGVQWFATSNLTVASPHSRSTTVVVSGSGALYLVDPPSAGHHGGDLPSGLPGGAAHGVASLSPGASSGLMPVGPLAGGRRS